MFGDTFDSPRTQGILAAAAALLGNRGSLSEGLSRGLLSGMVGFNQGSRNQREAARDNLAQQMAQLQMRGIQNQQTDQDAIRGFWSNPQNFMTGERPLVGPPAEGESQTLPSMPLPTREVSQRMLQSGSPALAQLALQNLNKQADVQFAPAGSAIIRDGQVVGVVPTREGEGEAERIVRTLQTLSPGDPRAPELRARLRVLQTPPQPGIVSLGAPQAVTFQDGTQGFVQPPNRPGAQPSVLRDPTTGSPLRPPPKSGEGRLSGTEIKMQQEAMDAIGTATGTQQTLQRIVGQIDSGQLSLGFTDNLVNRGRNFTGRSNEASRNLASFQATLEKLRNDSLRLNAGVQTDGDAQRAWNELLENINDPKVVRQRLGEIADINRRAVQLRLAQVEELRRNRGITEPLDISKITAPVEPGPSVGGSPLFSQDAIDAELRRRGNR
jgi:hypothetical protein